jgi:hypothetical protein
MTARASQRLIDMLMDVSPALDLLALPGVRPRRFVDRDLQRARRIGQGEQED